MAVFTLTAMHAQTHTDKELSKTERKALRKQVKAEEDSLNFEQAKEALLNGNFALQAQSIRLEMGRTLFVTSNLNFLKMRNLERGMLQVGKNGMLSGPNGVDGITLDGTIDNVKMYTDKRGDVHYTYDIWGVHISASIEITLYKNSTRASATVRPNFRIKDLYMDGDLVPLNESNLFEGRSI